MDIFTSLRLDHAAFRESLNEIIDKTAPLATGTTEEKEEGEAEWAELFHDLKLGIVGHNRAEEAIFYDVLHSIPGRADMAGAKIQEHHLLEELLEDLERINPADREWSSTIALASNTLDAHVGEEESNVFAIVAPFISEERSRVLAEQFERLRDDIIEAAKYHPKGRSVINPAGLDLEG